MQSARKMNARLILQHPGNTKTLSLVAVGGDAQWTANDSIEFKYEPFGQSIESGGTFADPFRFTGQFYDEEIGEYYLRARQYYPAIARFTARDPVFGKLGQPVTLHKYLYCGNDSVNRIDPAGSLLIVCPHKK